MQIQRVKKRDIKKSDNETTHYLLCPFMTFYALWYPRMKKGRKGTRGKKVRKV